MIDQLADAALLIDADGAQCLAANAAASLALGLVGASQFPLALDSAMPAIATLRAFARNPASPRAQTVRVTMWLGGRAITALCELSHVDASGNDKVIVVRLLDISGAPADNEMPSDPSSMGVGTIVTAAPHLAKTVQPDETEVDAESAPPVARDDAQTLKEIARRIREGLSPEPTREAAREKTPERTNSEARPPIERTSGTPAPAEMESSAISYTDDPIQSDTRAKLAHELKTPLSAIIAAAEIMRDERLGPMGNRQYLGYARDIHESATHALSVISHMLSVSQGDNDVHSRPHRVDLNDLAVRTVSSMQALAGERELMLDADLEAGLPYVMADETAIRQILLNLLANAFKFTPPGGAIRVATGYLANGSAFLVVRDTGDGMEQAVIDEVFGDQPSPTTRRRDGGYGIGLPLVRKLAKDMGADLEIDSAPLKGTVVLLSFPQNLLLDGVS